MKHDHETTIRFKTALFIVNTWIILRLPSNASEKLPSRGQVMIEATINNATVLTPLEPDGHWRHWMRVDAKLLNTIHAVAGDTVSVSMTLAKAWPEPEIPDDFAEALIINKSAKHLFDTVTPMARWEWLRWIRATNKSETRERRITVACSKLAAGEKRPCYWNRNLCTEPSVSKSGMLLIPDSSNQAV